VHWQLVTLAVILLGFAAVSRRIEGSPITAPMFFTAAGLVVGVDALGLVDPDAEGLEVEVFAEATLAVVRVLDKAFGTQTDMTDLVKQAQEQQRTIDQSITDPGTRAAIVELERQYDAAADRMDFLTTGPADDDEDPGALPATDDIFAEVERLLRGGEEGNS